MKLQKGSRNFAGKSRKNEAAAVGKLFPPSSGQASSKHSVSVKRFFLQKGDKCKGKVVKKKYVTVTVSLFNSHPIYVQIKAFP